MSVALSAGAVLTGLAGVGALLSLWRGADSCSGPVRHAYRWLTAAAGLWLAGVVLTHVLPAQGPFPLSFADIPSLFAAPVMVVALVHLSSSAPGHALGRRRNGWPGRARLAALMGDGFLTACGLFLLGWVAVFGGAFARAGMGPGTFAAGLARPLTDLLLLGAGLPLAAAAGRRGLLPYLAATAITVGDCLVVGARISGTVPGLGAALAGIAGFGLLAWSPRAGEGWPGKVWPRTRGRPHPGPVSSQPDAAAQDTMPAQPRRARSAAPRRAVTTLAAAAVVGLTALVMAAWVLAGAPMSRPVVPLVAAAMALALAARVVGLVREKSAAPESGSTAGWQFQQLADRTSDAVLLCDLAGVITYASQAVSGFGYSPDTLRGQSLADLLHPEDRAGGAWAVRKAVADSDGRTSRHPCRVRAADGTWRHVEATVSRYWGAGGSDHLLVTARDVSDKVALRRQVTHLTYHDGLTGLPNRAYVEQRARDALATGRSEAGVPPVAGVIFLDLDGFTAVNDEVGHSAGDLLLSQVAHRLRATVPLRDPVARWGGDQFAVLVEGVVSPEEIVDIAERLARAVAKSPFRLGEKDVALMASVGVAFTSAGPAGYVWRNADMALARAKAMGRGRVEVFTAAGGQGRGHDNVSDSGTKLLSG